LNKSATAKIMLLIMQISMKPQKVGGLKEKKNILFLTKNGKLFCSTIQQNNQQWQGDQFFLPKNNLPNSQHFDLVWFLEPKQ
jgi:hypothetical protein